MSTFCLAVPASLCAGGVSGRQTGPAGNGLAANETAGVGAKYDGEHENGRLDFLEFFDRAVSVGALYGTGGGKSAHRRLDALRTMLLNGRLQLDREEYREAGPILLDAFRRMDGDDQPGDLVTGPAAPELAARVWEVISVINFR